MSIASASTTIKFHEFPSGSVIHNYQPGTQTDGSVRSISWSKDGNWLAIVPYSGQAEIVSIKDRLKLIHTIQEIEEPSCVSFQSTTKKNIALGTKNGLVLIYDIKSRCVKKRYPRTTSTISHIQFTNKDGHVIAASASGDIFVYNYMNNCLSATFKVPQSNSVSALRTCPIKRNYLTAGSDAGVVAVWDINVNKHKFFINAHKAPVTSVVFSPINSDLVLSTGLDRQFCFYDLGKNKCIANIAVDNNITTADFSPDGKYVAMASQKGNILIYDSRNIQEPLHTFAAHNSAIKHLSFRKSEDLDVSMSSDVFNPVTQQSEPSNDFPHEHSFNICVMSPTVQELSKVSTICNNSGDSFLTEIGLEKNSTPGSTPNESVFLKKSESLRRLLEKATPPAPQRSLPEKVPNLSQMSSTPNYPKLADSPALSPIINITSAPVATQNQENAVDIAALREEFRNELNFHSRQILSQTRQMTLDLLMFMVKHSINMENGLNSLRFELGAESSQEQSHLLEENIALKQKLALVEEELILLKADKSNLNR